jgi:hypothetical protein
MLLLPIGSPGESRDGPSDCQRPYVSGAFADHVRPKLLPMRPPARVWKGDNSAVGESPDRAATTLGQNNGRAQVEGVG